MTGTVFDDPTQLPPGLRLTRIDDARYEWHQADDRRRRDVVNGVDLMAMMIVASGQARDDDKEVKSAHAAFARPVSPAAPVVIEVDAAHSGRTFATDAITVVQNGKSAARGLLLLTADEPDLIRHGAAMPDVADPEDLDTMERAPTSGTEVRIVGNIDYRSVDHPPGPPELQAWIRLPHATDKVIVNQALLCSATGTLLIGTAIRAHAGIGEDMAHRTISTGVVSHTINFHERFDPAEWLLLSQDSIYAGRGRSHGRGLVFTRDGTLVASYTQDNMIRHFNDGADHTDEYRTIM